MTHLPKTIFTRRFVDYLAIFITALILGSTVKMIWAAWSEPECGPTGCNTETPINVSSTAQTKSGDLTVLRLLGRETASAFEVYGNTAATNGPGVEFWGNSSARPGEVTLIAGNSGRVNLMDYNGVSWDTNLTVLGSGNVGIGTSSPQDNLDVAGRIRVGGLGTATSTGYLCRNSSNQIAECTALPGGTDWTFVPLNTPTGECYDCDTGVTVPAQAKEIILCAVPVGITSTTTVSPGQLVFSGTVLSLLSGTENERAFGCAYSTTSGGAGIKTGNASHILLPSWTNPALFSAYGRVSTDDGVDNESVVAYECGPSVTSGVPDFCYRTSDRKIIYSNAQTCVVSCSPGPRPIGGFWWK